MYTDSKIKKFSEYAETHARLTFIGVNGGFKFTAGAEVYCGGHVRIFT
jgi:hypothetical protein